MKSSYTYSFNRRWHVVWSWKQLMFGYSCEFDNIHIVSLGCFSVMYIGG